MTRLFLALVAIALPGRAPAVDADRMIRVLVEMEGGEPTDFGGAAHLQHSTWSQHSKLAYQLSRRPEYALPVYRLHLAWLERTLAKNGVRPTPRALALCWRWGFEGAKRARFKGEYGDRAAALFADAGFK